MVDLTTWTGMLAFAATTGIITAILNQAFGIAREVWATSAKRQSEAGYHAARLATILESYAYACAKFVWANDEAEARPHVEEYPDWKCDLPELLPYPEEAEGWHALDLKLTVRTLDLRNHIAGSQGVIYSTIEYAMDDLGYTLEEHAAERGLEAWTLAADLRSGHGLPPFEPVYNFVEALHKARANAAHTKASREQHQSEL